MLRTVIIFANFTNKDRLIFERTNIMKPKFNDAKVKEMVTRYKNKESATAIADSMKTTTTTVTKYLKKEGVFKRRRRKGIKKVIVSKAAKLSSGSLGVIEDKLVAAKAEVKRLEILLKKTFKQKYGN